MMFVIAFFSYSIVGKTQWNQIMSKVQLAFLCSRTGPLSLKKGELIYNYLYIYSIWKMALSRATWQLYGLPCAKNNEASL